MIREPVGKGTFIYASLKYGTLFALMALSLCIVAIGGAASPMIWPSLSFALVSVGYFGVGPKVLGKRKDGRLSSGMIVLLLPYLALLHLSWFLARFRREVNAHDTLVHQVLIGRRLRATECPVELSAVVDLAAEFGETRPLRSVPHYLNLPALDTLPPTMDAMRHALTTLDGISGRVFIHCAEGHGRTGTFAAALLIHRKHAQSVDEALAMVAACRPACGCPVSKERFWTPSPPSAMKGRCEPQRPK